MGRNAAILFASALVLLGGIVVFIGQDTQTNETEIARAEPTQAGDGATDTDTDTAAIETAVIPAVASIPVATTGGGVFTDYEPALVTTENADQINVLFFAASWCITCRNLENQLTSQGEDIPANVQILKLDYDSETELKEKYNVRSQHTLVQVDGNGEMITSWVGSPNLTSLIKKIQ